MTASIFSGRPDPRWTVSARTLRRLERLWQQLEAAEELPSPQPPLGYRGVTLDCGDGGRWFAYRGTVSRGGDHRWDPERQFERELVQSAPKGLIPVEVLREFG